MARSITDIEQELRDARPDTIKLLKVDRVTSVLGAIFYCVAYAINALERVLDTFKIEVDNTLATKQPSTRQWYGEQVMKFKGGVGYSVVDGIVKFEDEEAAFEVSRVAVTEVDDTGTSQGSLKIKVAKGDVGSEGPLTASELLNLKSYIEDIKYAGTVIEPISTAPDELSVDATIYYDPVLSSDDIKSNVEATLKNYIETLRFDGKVFVNEVMDALTHTTGVVDVTLTNVLVNGVAVSRVTELASGYLKEDDVNTWATTITYINNATT